MEYYRQIVDCEARYEEMMKRKPYGRSPRFFLILGAIPLVFAVIMLYEGIAWGMGGQIGSSLLFFAIGIPLILFGMKRRRAANEEYDAAYAKWNASMDAIIDEVRQYV